MIDIDFEKLRRDIIEELETAMLVGGFDMAIIGISDVEQSSDDELVEIAKNLGIKINKEK